MLLVTLLLVSAILVLAMLAGPFGRELTIRQQPTAHWTAIGSADRPHSDDPGR
jgi:hypothetical protein